MHLRLKTEKYISRGLKEPFSCSSIYIDKELIQQEDGRSRDCPRLLGTVEITQHTTPYFSLTDYTNISRLNNYSNRYNFHKAAFWVYVPTLKG